MSHLISLLYQALDTPFGLVVESNDPDRLRQLLYKERRAKNDPRLNDLTFAAGRADPATQLWIINRGKETAEAPGESDHPSE